jgi:hypothetical protein
MSTSRRLSRASERSLLYLLFTLIKETWNILECYTASRRVATSSGCLAETFQIVSTEMQLCVELEKLDLASRRCYPDVQMSASLKLLDIAGRLDAFKGQSERLHRNRLADLEFCIESL